MQIFLIVVWLGMDGGVAATNMPFTTMAECHAVERQVQAREWNRALHTDCVGAGRK